MVLEARESNGRKAGDKRVGQEDKVFTAVGQS